MQIHCIALKHFSINLVMHLHLWLAIRLLTLKIVSKAFASQLYMNQMATSHLYKWNTTTHTHKQHEINMHPVKIKVDST